MLKNVSFQEVSLVSLLLSRCQVGCALWKYSEGGLYLHISLVSCDHYLVIERTRGTVGYSGKPKPPHECPAQMGNRGWSTITHRSRVLLFHLKHGLLPSANHRPRKVCSVNISLWVRQRQLNVFFRKKEHT